MCAIAMAFNWKIIIGTWVILSQTRVISGQKCKITGSGGPQEFKACIFPFQFQSQIHNSCTVDGDPDNLIWCSTRVDQYGVHVGGGRGFWGYCDPNCDQYPTKLESDYPTEYRAQEESDYPVKYTPQEESDYSLDYVSSDPNVLPTEYNGSEENDYPTDYLDDYSLPPTNDGEADSTQSILSNHENGTWLPSANGDFCGLRTDVGYIIGGSSVVRGEFPFMAMLGFKALQGRTFYLCSGTLINRRYVLTAAHCQGSNPSNQIREVVLGEHNLSKDPDCYGCARVQRFEIAQEDVIVHEDWNPANIYAGHDIALVRLPTLAKTIHQDLNEIVMPACLLHKAKGKPMGETVAVGWGKVEEEDNAADFYNFGAATRTPRKLELPLIRASDCEKVYRHVLAPHLVCAGGLNGRDTCTGDSGGPLIARNGLQDPMWLVGIVSFGSASCGTGVPGVFTRVDHYLPWIRAHLKA